MELLIPIHLKFSCSQSFLKKRGNKHVKILCYLIFPKNSRNLSAEWLLLTTPGQEIRAKLSKTHGKTMDHRKTIWLKTMGTQKRFHVALSRMPSEIKIFCWLSAYCYNVLCKFFAFFFKLWKINDDSRWLFLPPEESTLKRSPAETLLFYENYQAFASHLFKSISSGIRQLEPFCLD